MRYGFGKLGILVALGRDEGEGAWAAYGADEEPSAASSGYGPDNVADGWSEGHGTASERDDAWHAGGVGEHDRDRGVGQSAPMGSPEGRVRRRLLDAIPTSVLLIIGVAVFGLCTLISRSSFNLRVLGLSTQEWLLFSYTALLIATLEGRESRIMGVVTTACAILTIVVLSLQVWTWAKDGSFCLLRLPGPEASVVQDAAGEVAPGDLGTFEAWTVNGKGDDDVPIDCRPVPCLIDVAYTGDGDFALVARDAGGRQRDLLVDTTGSYEGQVTTYSDEGDAASLEVRADGAWELRFAPMDAVECVEFDERGASEVFHGDSVVYVGEEPQGTLGFAHRGEGGFRVKAVTEAGSELLVDATGAYEGTVAWTGPAAFLVVSADGDWTLSRS